MNIINLFKHWKTSIAIIVIKLLTVQAVFASMGSTGGGDTGGGSTGGGTSSYSSSSAGDGNGGGFLFIAIIIGIFIVYVLLGIIILELRESRDTRAVSGLSKWMLMPNMKISEFQDALKVNHIKLVNGKQIDSQLAQILIDTYAKAQFTYGQSIRRCFTSGNNSLDILKQQLGQTFLATMRDEIKDKAAEGIIDDVMVNHGNIVSFKQISANVVIAKVQAIGLDNEVNVLSHFNSSFKRQQWTDYVVFGREKEDSEWKIYNIIYGEHFHLNGKDYNQQASLDKAKVTEQRLEVSPELIKAAKAYKRQINWQERAKAIIIWSLIGGALIYQFAIPIIEFCLDLLRILFLF